MKMDCLLEGHKMFVASCFYFDDMQTFLLSGHDVDLAQFFSGDHLVVPREDGKSVPLVEIGDPNFSRFAGFQSSEVGRCDFLFL